MEYFTVTYEGIEYFKELARVATERKQTHRKEQVLTTSSDSILTSESNDSEIIE